MSGRPHSPGLKYFPVDVDIFRNSKILDLKEDYRSEGLLFYMQLLSTIYSKGHYIIWDRSTNRDFRQAYEYTDAQIKQYIDAVLKVDLLSKVLFEKYNVLTSDAIQERYLYSTKKRERIYYVEEYLLIKFENFRSIPQPVVVVDVNGVFKYDINKEPDPRYIKKSLRKDISESKPKTEPEPVALKKEIPDGFERLTPLHTRDMDLETKAAQFFHYNEIADKDKVILFGQFLTSLNNRGELEKFRQQFPAYIQYKEATGYKHNFNTFLGEQSQLFKNGAWNKENWQEKLKEKLAQSHNKNGKTHIRGYTPENGYGQI